MPFLYRNLLRPFLFRRDSEEIHNFTVSLLGRISRDPLGSNLLRGLFEPLRLPIKLCGLQFPNPLGLAAGMDKNATALPAWAALGFGFTELGGATWHAQSGNPAPRMFRAVPERALVNRMGFNNLGAETIAERLKMYQSLHLWPDHPVGINLGKSKITPLDEAAGDYASSLRLLWEYGDFFVINVSSPNTPNLRQLQDKSALASVLALVQKANKDEALRSGIVPRPILVKFAPDLSWEALYELLEVALFHSVSGIVATNTTLERPQISTERSRRVFTESGGLSGSPLRARSTEIIRHIYRKTQGRLPIIGVGGIFTSADAWEKITAGASLVQIYSGLVFEGPGICREIIEGLAARLESHGFASIHQAIGINNLP